MSKGTKLFAAFIFAAVLILLVYGLGDTRGYRAGLLQGAAIKTIQSKKAATAAAKAAAIAATAKQRAAAAKKAAQESNPFKNTAGNSVINPLVNAKKVLNPFD